MAQERDRILSEIDLEREKQIRMWGNSHDDSHSLAMWFSIMCYEGQQAVFHRSVQGARSALVKAAAVCVAAIEAIDRQTSEPDEPFPEAP